MTKKELAAVHLRAAMASIEAAWAVLELDPADEHPGADPETCEHAEDSREYVAMGQWTCKDCGHKAGG